MRSVNALGIMQGRLSLPAAIRAQSFPFETWKQEFSLARTCGFDLIEWLATADRLEENPLWTDAGLQEIRERIADTGVGVRSLCADCFLERPFFRVSESARRDSIETLTHLIGQSGKIGVAVVLVPVLEATALRTDDEAMLLLESLHKPLSMAEKVGIVVGLETDRAGSACRALIDRGNSPALGAYYDTGNAAEKGYDVGADIRTLSDRLCGVHIKDRRRSGPSLALGLGDADFAACFDAMRAVSYDGPLILETPRGSDPIESATAHLAFVKARMHARADG